ncbi:MAG TPA: DNA repair protein RecO [Candidatus Sulfotelmatobacter sp.]|nr:DNA repair protein RecO [Candidatus Sulfotelmatobacter sp.]
MKKHTARAIILSRTDYGEADRIVRAITPDQGKLTLMVKGSRKVKSKLAGGIELFSVNDITFIEGRGEIGTMISSRLKEHYPNITKDIKRVETGYEALKVINTNTEDQPGSEYFELLEKTLRALNDDDVNVDLVQCWLPAQIVRLAGNKPNLYEDSNGEKLQDSLKYNFSSEDMCFTQAAKGRYSSSDIKLLRLLYSGHDPSEISKIENLATYLDKLKPLLRSINNIYL